jgi:hypothetical protein
MTKNAKSCSSKDYGNIKLKIIHHYRLRNKEQNKSAILLTISTKEYL